MIVGLFGRFALIRFGWLYFIIDMLYFIDLIGRERETPYTPVLVI